MITIKHCQDYIEANIYKSKLEDAGITCFLENELANFTPYNSFMNQGVKLVENEKDVQEALEILNISNPNAIYCPNCGSEDIQIYSTKNIFQRIAILLFQIILSIPIITKTKSKYTCNHCNDIFEK